jgi:hypothetical protein
MFGKFGEMGSADEINELAGNLLTEGDTVSIKTLAEENGIPVEYAEMYISGDIPVMCDAQTAAAGKIDIEAAELKPQDIMADWVEYIKAVCIEDEDMARKVRAKGKSLKGCIGALLKWSFGHQQPVDKDILKEAKVSASKVTLGIPGQATARKLIREYYGGRK